jgi:hypothetical protein
MYSIIFFNFIKSIFVDCVFSLLSEIMKINYIFIAMQFPLYLKISGICICA